MMKMESLKKAERKSKVQQKGNFKINPSAANLNNKHRRSQ